MRRRDQSSRRSRVRLLIRGLPSMSRFPTRCVYGSPTLPYGFHCASPCRRCSLSCLVSDTVHTTGGVHLVQDYVVHWIATSLPLLGCCCRCTAPSHERRLLHEQAARYQEYSRLCLVFASYEDLWTLCASHPASLTARLIAQPQLQHGRHRILHVEENDIYNKLLSSRPVSCVRRSDDLTHGRAARHDHFERPLRKVSDLPLVRISSIHLVFSLVTAW